MTDILTTAEAALAEIRARHLHADHFAVRKPQQGNMLKHDRATGTYTRPCLPEIDITVHGDTAAFLAWCDYLNATEVRAWRGGVSVYFHLDNDQAGLCWRVKTSVKRLPSGPCLPGIKPKWDGKDVWISVADLRVTLAALEQTAVAS